MRLLAPANGLFSGLLFFLLLLWWLAWHLPAMPSLAVRARCFHAHLAAAHIPTSHLAGAARARTVATGGKCGSDSPTLPCSGNMHSSGTSRLACCAPCPLSACMLKPSLSGLSICHAKACNAPKSKSNHGKNQKAQAEQCGLSTYAGLGFGESCHLSTKVQLQHCIRLLFGPPCLL